MRADAVETLDAFLLALQRRTEPGLRLGAPRHARLTARFDGLSSRGTRRWSFHLVVHHRGGRRDVSLTETDERFVRTASPQVLPSLESITGAGRRVYLHRCPGLLLLWSDPGVRLLSRGAGSASPRHADLDPDLAGMIAPPDLAALRAGLRRLLPVLGDGRHALVPDPESSGHARLAVAACRDAFPVRGRVALDALAQVGHRPEILAAERRALLLLPPRPPPLAFPSILAATHAKSAT